ncbi:Phospholipid-transporting ATPase ABCA3 (ABC-C transporter) (ATP-binding cassette sub-family A member 3) (ATP-binding cassette transporter 3) (ATP-binding cassette 3) (Xenobiotic-transporting ATPase ABCA3) [Cleaved into: 150 Kda mature form], partial [Durusdinium trenchii]
MSTFMSAPLMSQLFTMVVYCCSCALAFIPTNVSEWIFMFIPQFAYSKALTVYMSNELTKWEGTYDEDSYTLIGTLGWLLLDAILWLLLWLYLDQVIPHGGGTTQKPWFPCDKGYWKGEDGVVRQDPGATEMVATSSFQQARDPWLLNGQEATEAAEPPEVATEAPPHWQPPSGRRSVDEALSIQGRNSLIEPVDRGMVAQILAKNCVKVDDLCVYFKGIYNEEIKAVDGVNFVMFPGEIFALLGHNGAGKSTTMSAMVGLTAPTKGVISAFGRKVPEDLVEVRKSMGFCPQHDVLFPALTVVQHIELFSALAGRQKSDEAEVFKLVSDIGLHSRAHYQVTQLSGGMKRKLSVGLAFSGEPNLVILDEPTSGMDPFSRRGLWDFLKLRRQGRAMLLTTHFMDEAGVLGDRVAIMRAGTVQACGTADFLKRRFGCGYVLTIVMEERSSSHEPVRQLLGSILGHTLEISGVGKEILANIPMECESQLSSCLAALSEKKVELSLATFGVSVSNLEEVFLKVASGDHASKQDQKEAETSFQAAMEEVEAQAPQGPCFVMPNPGGTVMQQMRGLLERRGSTAIRDMKTFNMGCLAPVLMLVFATWIGAKIVRDNKPLGAPGAPVPIELSNLKATFASTEGGMDGVDLIKESTKTNYKCFTGDYSGWTPQTCDVDSEADRLTNIPYGYLEQCKSKYKYLELDCKKRWLRHLLAFDELL